MLDWIKTGGLGARLRDRRVTASLTLALAAAMTGPVAADSSFVELAACTGGPVGTEFGCTAEEMMAALSGLEPAWGYRLRDSADTEAYAIVSVLGSLQQGFESWASGKCDRAQELAYSAGEIWTWYVSIGEDANEQGAIDFSTVKNFTDTAIMFLSDPQPGSCP